MNSELNLKENIESKNEVYMDENGNPVQTQYVDEFGNPIDPSLIDKDGNYIGATTQYVDEQGNPIDPSLIDENGNYIGNNQYVDEFGNPINQNFVDKNSLHSDLNSAANDTAQLDAQNAVTGVQTQPISASERQMEGKEMLTGMVTFDYNNVPITDIVNSIILDAINKGASDIHFDPFEEGIKIRIRIDGQLNDYSIVPLYVKKNMITRIKIISGMNITESRIPQDGAIRTELQNKTVDLRVSCLPTNMGEKIVIRIMDYSMSAAGIEALDFNQENLEKVKKMLALPNGIILVTGATGTGKSTTVYAMLQRLNVEGTNIVTVEDPIEMNIGGINQVQAATEIGLNFATVLRSILRQDPDVIMIGEIRDDETARIAVRASITGHLVLSTLHTNNSLNTIERLTDMSVERYLLGSSLEGIISQKLSRRLCEKCRRLRPTTDYEKEIFKKTLNKDVTEIYEPVGCPECSRGYRGRIAIHEVLLLNQAIKDAITDGTPKEILRTLVYGNGETKTMLQDGLEKVLEGKTSFAEILKLIDLEDDLGTGTQLGLQDQINASAMNFNPKAMNIPYTFPNGAMPMYIPYPVAQDSEDEEIVIKPSKKKKKTVVEIDPDELKEMLKDDNETTEKTETLESLEDDAPEKLEDEEVRDTTPTPTPEPELQEIKEEIPQVETNPMEIELPSEEKLDDVELTDITTEPEPVLTADDASTDQDTEKLASVEDTKDLRELIDSLNNSLSTLYETKKITGKKKYNEQIQDALDAINPSIQELIELDDKIRFDDKTETDIKEKIKGIALNLHNLKDDADLQLYKNTKKDIDESLDAIVKHFDLEDIHFEESQEETSITKDDSETPDDIADIDTEIDSIDDTDEEITINPQDLLNKPNINIEIAEDDDEIEDNDKDESDKNVDDVLKMLDQEFSEEKNEDDTIKDEDIDALLADIDNLQ